MATREENLKKINEELEKLDDEQLEQLSDEELDKVAGGALPIGDIIGAYTNALNSSLSEGLDEYFRRARV